MTFWNWFIKSLYNKKLIAYSRFRPITSTIWHVLFVIFIASIPFLISMNMSAVSSVKQLQDTLHKDLPSFHLVGGVLQSENDEKYVSSDDGIGVILIDTSKTYTDEELSELTNGIALLRNKITIINEGNIQSVSYSLLGVTELSKEQLTERIDDLKGFLPILLVIATILMYLGLTGVAFIGVTVVSYLGLLLRGSRKTLHYRHLWVMSAHALTLPVILLYWIDTLYLKVPISLFLIATFILLFLAIRSVPIQKNK